MSWHGRLDLQYHLEGARCVAHDRHEGPLRVLKALYPEGDAICHHVLVHPPGGVAGGDRLDIAVEVGAGAHTLITSAGATRFYRSDAEPASQCARLNLHAEARLEWLPLETIAYPGCRAANRVRFALAPGAQCLGWDLLALGLPASDAAFDSGWIEQQIHWPGVWLERGHIAADDARLLASPLGLGGHRALGTLWFASHTPWDAVQRDALLDEAREAASAHGLAALAGVTAPDPRLLLVRVLTPRIEPSFALLSEVRTRWRTRAWRLPTTPPRVWRT